MENTLHGRFLRGLAVAADRDAFRVAGHGVTYAETHRSALSWAGELHAASGGRPRAVGVLASKSATAYIGTLAALYAGAAVVPLHPGFPAARTRQALVAAGVSAIVTDERGVGLLPGILESGPDLPVLVAERGARPEVALDRPLPVDPQDTAYVLFTSGSTGRPKGVPISHGSTAHYFRTLDARYDFTPHDVFSQTFDLTFDCAMFDLFCAWGAGACVVPVPAHAYRAFPEFVAEQGMTVWFSTPSSIALLRKTGALAPDALSGLRWSLFAGEPLRSEDAQEWLCAASGSTLENLYGPTELTITCATHRWSPQTSPDRCVNGVVPIGPVYDGLDHILVDPDGEPGDDEGELCVSGPQMCAGYLDPNDNHGRFLERDSRTWYRTGDRVRRFADGELAYLGRVDDQVQLQGWRVELSEISHAVRACPGVEEAAVVVAPLAGDELVVFYTGRPAAPVELARALRSLLPQDLIPRHFQHLDGMPLNANRKIDRVGLRSRAEELFTPAARMLHELLDETASATPDALAVRDTRESWTYRQLAEQSHAFAHWLTARGVVRGERILVQLPNMRELVAMFYGCARLGVVMVPLNPCMKEFHLRSVIEDSEPRLAVVEEPAVAALRELSGLPVHGVGAVWSELAALGGAVQTADSGAQPSDLGVLIYTSGSTAAPKAVMCPQAQMTFAARAIQEELGYRADDVVYCRVPLSFDYGLFQILLSCLAGAELVLAGGQVDIKLLSEIREYGATVFPAVPSLAQVLVRLGERDPGETRLRMFTNTGAALQQMTIDGLRRSFPGASVVRMFGTTECKRISVMPPDLEHERPDSVGRPLPGTQVVVLDEAGAALPPGESGEITVTGPHVMAGYWRAPELTARTFRRDERTGEVRLHTGDYGWLDADGFLYFGGRRDDVFKRSGTRMSTTEIEAAAMDIPGVRAAAVLAPTEERDLALCVVGDVRPTAVRRELARRLERAKIPEICLVLDELPLTLNGKNEKKQLAVLVDQALRGGADGRTNGNGGGSG
ncbi:AMP-binding protein [Streptomyces sp. NPDC057136]|uniref:AMP-binding protein n=1 Tax=Streptomyces sp. NPDC057136 TaxID=3346029 RepID=UPI00363E0170